MDIVKMFDRRIVYLATAIALLLATALPSLVGAEQLTARSIELSSSSKAATNVTYNIDFTTVNAADSFVVDFCDNTPLIGEVCDAPAGFSVSSATTSTANYTRTVEDANTLQLDNSAGVTAGNPFSVEIAGVTNPTASGPLYARITTYTTANVASYTDAETLGTYEDSGSVAISITDSIGVSGAVLESMVFCVSAAAPEADCTATTAPTLELGENTGGVLALSPSAVSTGDLYAQISTNAASGAVVSLKSSAAGCGGLMRAGAPGACDIAPAQQLDIGVGDALFGVKVAPAADPVGAGNPNGTFQAKSGSSYNASTFALDYNATDESTGVTSTYGDPFLDTNGAPVNNKNMQMTFGASIGNDTPAGLYSADLSLIATGTF